MAKAICIFCGRGPTTLEHRFPDWINREFPTVKPASMTLIRSEGAQRRWPNRKPASVSYQVVCKECNNEWMSEVEAKAKPIILDLIRGRERQLDTNDQIDLGTWATMKAYVRVAGSGPEVSDASSRRLLMEERRPPANVRVLLAYYAPHASLACYHVPVETVETESAALAMPGFATTFVLIHGVDQVVGREGSAFPWPEVAPRMMDDVRSIIPPFGGPVDWPAGKPLDESNVEAFAMQLLDIRRVGSDSEQ